MDLTLLILIQKEEYAPMKIAFYSSTVTIDIQKYILTGINNVDQFDISSISMLYTLVLNN